MKPKIAPGILVGVFSFQNGSQREVTSIQTTSFGHGHTRKIGAFVFLEYSGT